MAKKFGKFLMFTAAVGAVAAGAYYYMQNKNKNNFEDDDDFDDFDDFSEDLDDDETTKDSSAKERSYVSLNLDDANPAEEKVSDTVTTPENLEKVEEFFDEDDDTDNTLNSI